MKSIDTKKRTLVHICCAPCSASVVKVLQNIYDISFYWYNPNIYDEKEYKNRKESAVRYAKELEIQFHEDPKLIYNYEDWKDKSYEQCNLCYALRLERTAIFAKDNDFDFFTTSLLSSPHQKHDLIKKAAVNFASKYAVEFLYYDYRPGFYEGKNLLRRKGYYMQKYCACNRSYKERFSNI
jgi:predicted adenine nucleotide alpha hydrolase (AANH) superfamily ATPase